MNRTVSLPAWLLALIVVLIAGVSGVFVTSTDDGTNVTIRHTDPSPTPAERQLPMTPAAHDFDAQPEGTIQLSNGAMPVAAEPPEAVADKQTTAVDQGTYDTSGVLTGAAAQPAHKTCPRFGNNGGPRSIKSIGLMVAHVTVSLNVVGTSDGDNLCNFFTRVQASSTWIVDNEGNSWLNVPLDRVPWTQAWFNHVSCSIEYVGSTGRPGEGPAQWTDAQLREGGRLFAKCAKLAGIPIRPGAVSGGNVIRTGLITHQELGLRGGGHRDPGPYWSESRQLLWINHFAQTATCNQTCRSRSLNARHAQTHHSLRALHCSVNHPRSKNCRRLAGRNVAIHHAARRENVTLAG